jgi:hypothetical protein
VNVDFDVSYIDCPVRSAEDARKELSRLSTYRHHSRRNQQSLCRLLEWRLIEISYWDTAALQSERASFSVQKQNFAPS